MFGTATTRRWQTAPGSIDPLNLRVLWPRFGRWGIPMLDPVDFEPTCLAAWHDPGGRATAADTGGALHFFLDDYRFERVWTRPTAVLERLESVGAALTPDFSLWRDTPLAVQLWQIYRSRWCGAWWQYNGITTIPTATWAGPDSYEFAFEGLPQGSVLAISPVGVRDQESRDLFRSGLAELLRQTQPSRLLVYGHLPDDCAALDLPAVREYPTFWQTRTKAKTDVVCGSA